MPSVQASAVPAKPLGIVAALPQEIAHLLDHLRQDPAMRTVSVGRRDYHLGTLWGRPCVVTLARIGKVAAATTAAAMIHAFDVGAIVFTGVAGGLGHAVRVGDIVVADALMQHDMDASPLFPRHQIPLLELDRFAPDPALSAALARAAAHFVSAALPALRAEHGWTLVTHQAAVHQGLIASGDRFVSAGAERDVLCAAVPDALAVEMEGGAIAQVCHEYEVPYAVMRTISDSADDGATVSFSQFLEEVASVYSYGVIRRLLEAELSGT
jgi:adenosylhomocysteine nucleosidase